VSVVLLRGDARELPLPDESVDLIVTSPPYYALRDYQDGGGSMAGQIGGEETPAQYIAALLECTREWMRVLKPSGSLLVNLGDKYSQRTQIRRSSHQPGIFPGKFEEFGETWAERARKGAVRMPHQNVITGDGGSVLEKSLMQLPQRYSIACTDQLGLILRRDIIWAKQSALPESVTDRCGTRHEYLFHLTRQPRYFAAIDEIREPHADVSIRRAMPHRAVSGLMHGNHPSGTEKHMDMSQACHPLGSLPGSVWKVASQPLAVPDSLGMDHFAAFPMEIPRRAILGWSPAGICTECGEGRHPVAERERIDIRPGYSKTHNGHRSGVPQSGGTKWKTKGRTDVSIIGYACACPEPTAPTRPALVVDPFGGTGTTALVADALGRIGISVDRSADYCRLAQWRTTDPGERAKALQVPKPPPVIDGQESLFEVGA
jgi:DNA modification methylase